VGPTHSTTPEPHLESSTPKRERGWGGVSPPQLGVWVALYKLLGGVQGKAPAENGFGEI